VSMMAPDKEAVKIPSEDQIRAAIENVRKAPLTPKVEETMNKPLIQKAPVAGKIVKTTQNKSLGTTEWTLSNGVKVILKPTTFKKDEILLNAFSEGGLSKISNNADLPSGTLAASIVSNNGLGEFTSVELGKILTGKIASVSPSIGAYDQGFTGNSSVNDFETMLQLVYLNFTAPRRDDNAFKAMMNAYRASLANISSDPRKAFSDSVNIMMTNHNPRTVIMSLKTLDLIDQDKALAIFKQRFEVPAYFTFTFTGNIDPANESMKKAICTYLGGLKSKQGVEKFNDNNVRKPVGKVDNHFAREMKVNKASNFVLYHAPMPYNVNNRTIVTAIGNILTIRYTESIREKEGGTYGVGVRGSINNTPIEEATLLMQFDCDPVKQARLISIIYSEIDEILTKGPRPDDVQKVKENMLKKYSEDVAENGWWQSTLEHYYMDKLNLVDDYKPSVEALTPELIQTTLKNIVSKGNVLEVVMKPAEK